VVAVSFFTYHTVRGNSSGARFIEGYLANIQHIRAEEADQGRMHLPIIAVTAMTLICDKEQSLTAGMDMFISKPVSKAVLENKVLEAKALRTTSKMH
jgi:CheY-like chemotaxis protein